MELYVNTLTNDTINAAAWLLQTRLVDVGEEEINLGNADILAGAGAYSGPEAWMSLDPMQIALVVG